LTSPLGPEGVVELAVVERSGFPEARHLGAAVLTDRSGVAVRELGDSRALLFARSSLKPFQAVASLRAGAPLTGAHLAIAVASHDGTPAHVQLVREVLAAAGLDESALRCPGPLPVAMNCSGKHAGFLSACVASGWTTDDYLDPAHPLQLGVLAAIEELTGEPVEASGVDGCGAPLHATTLAGTALAISRVVRGEVGHGSDILEACLANGWALDGPGRPNAVVIDELGLFAKGGAEGFMLMAAPTGEAVAVKVIDGGYRAATLIALELLAQGGVIDHADADRVAALATPQVTGGDQVVGRIRPAFS
jgi:L-asparaginase II